ncbi:hypothetical protein ACJJIF_09710 [Microbulbifer sp. SSSA002]|uniref:hypothetical protein n=1 Tax=unclassified Microbulbifer TaxID=2619833 RepID=UPI00403A50DE
MKAKWIALGCMAFSLGALLLAHQLKSKEAVVSARYEKLACESCYHMTVVKSSSPDLLGKTIIPIASDIDIEKMINDIVLKDQKSCLRGRPYVFNYNIFKINPGGIRFKVISQELEEACESISK